MPGLRSSFNQSTDHSLAADEALIDEKVMPLWIDPAGAEKLAGKSPLNAAGLGFWSGAESGTCRMAPPPSASEIAQRAASFPRTLLLYDLTAQDVTDHCPQLVEPVRQWGRALHQAGVANLVAAAPVPELLESGPEPGARRHLGRDPGGLPQGAGPVRAAQAAGARCGPGMALADDPDASPWLLDAPPLGYRLTPGFTSQSLGLTGVHHWAVDHWSRNAWADVTYRSKDGQAWPGEGLLVYRVPPPGVTGVVSSMRLKWIRDGVEDYDGYRAGPGARRAGAREGAGPGGRPRLGRGDHRRRGPRGGPPPAAGGARDPLSRPRPRSTLGTCLPERAGWACSASNRAARLWELPPRRDGTGLALASRVRDPREQATKGPAWTPAAGVRSPPTTGGLLLRDAARPRGREPARPPGARALRLGADRRAVGRARDAEIELFNQGITFTVYGERGSDRADLPVRPAPADHLAAEDWAVIERGLTQRVTALNLFLHDVYHERRILATASSRPSWCFAGRHYRPRDARRRGCRATPTSHVVRHRPGPRRATASFVVLEDNLRVAVAACRYVLENRQAMMQRASRRCSREYRRPAGRRTTGQRCSRRCARWRRAGVDDPTVVLLTPGVYNSAYFEHAFLARQMGVELVEGRDLVVPRQRRLHADDRGLRRVDVIYRRVDDDFLDPLAFRADSALGVPGLFSAYRAGNVTLANALGTGVADDKAIYAYVPRIIRYYLDQEPILANVETYADDATRTRSASTCADRLGRVVVKAVGGVGRLRHADRPAQHRGGARGVPRADRWPTRATTSRSRCSRLSTAPCFIDGAIEPRHVDLRPLRALRRRDDHRCCPAG